MKNTKILSLILKKTNSRIISDEYKEAYILGKSFSRNRKLSFSNTIHFICSGLRKSISTEIDNFIEEYPYLKFPSISKQAFSKARQNISPEAFKELCTLFVNEFYNLKKDLRTWNGFNVLAYDVLNDIIIDARITRYKTSERAMAKQHIDSISDQISLQNSIVIFDRGYPSYDMFDYLNNEGLFFLMRVSESFKVAQAIEDTDAILNYKFQGEIKKVRVIKVRISDEITEVLLTNIYDTNISPAQFKELYFLRWGVESKYKELKSSLNIEEFSGTKPIAIEQDFYTSIYLSMIAALIKKDADTAIADDNKDKPLNSIYQSNRNFILALVFKRLIPLLVKSRLRKKILDLILEKSIKIRSQIRSNRSRERKNKHPRKKHHHNIKSCI